MADKSLKDVNDVLAPKGGTSLVPTDYDDDYMDLETLVNDMKTYRGDAALPVGTEEINKYKDAADAMTTCTCNSRTYADPVSCGSRTSCSCNLRSTSCNCNGRTQSCICNARNGCHCETRAWCDCQNRGSCNCNTRTACSCNSRTGTPLDVFG